MSNIIKAHYISEGDKIVLCDNFISNQAQQGILEEVEECIEEGIQYTEQMLATTKEVAKELMDSAKEEADQVLNSANEEAARIVEKARKEAEQILEQANIEHEQNIEQTKQQLIEQEKLFKQKLEEYEHQHSEQCKRDRQEKLSELESNIHHAIHLLVGHIVSRELMSSYQWVECIVKKMIEEENILEKVIINLSENNARYFEANEPMGVLGSQTKIKANETLNDTSIRLETKEGNIFYDVSEGLKQALIALDQLQK